MQTMSSMLTIELRLSAHSSRTDLSAEYSDARGSAKDKCLIKSSCTMTPICKGYSCNSLPVLGFFKAILDGTQVVKHADWLALQFAY